MNDKGNDEAKDICFATASVCTLHANKTRAMGTELSGRTQLLEMAFDRAGADIVGIREGRVLGDQQKSGLVY